MGKFIIKTKDLSRIGYTDDISRSIGITVVNRYLKHLSKEEVLQKLIELKNNPENFLDNIELSSVAQTFLQKNKVNNFSVHSILEESKPFNVFGGKEIEGIAKRQMELAMRLPIAVYGALMPDAHAGFGLPVGGVLATRDTVIPYAVGVDIGCRMALSIFEVGEKFLSMNSFALKKAIGEFTHFGMDGGLNFLQEHEVLDRNEFQSTDLLRKLHGKAVKQLGSSGGGNHFVEFGIIQLYENNSLAIPGGNYLALLSHSGSRGLGATIANHYTQIAMDTCKLSREAQQLAWLDLESEAGEEYWMSMNLAGDYAKACHDRIHFNLSKAIGAKPIAKVENHHNFAWKEQFADATTLIVHRKGATPAHSGELGIIPGSMATPGYLVSGKGSEKSLFSASHGSGRKLSRGNARESFTMSAMKKILSSAGVTLIGGSTEECPLAYKDIDKVMSYQENLVKVEGKFIPKIVRMNKE